MTSRIKKEDPKAKVYGHSTLEHHPNRPGYGSKNPVNERFTQTVIRDGKKTRTEVNNVQFKDSGTRAADKAAARGETLPKKEVERLQAQDRKNINISTTKNQANAAKINANGGPTVLDRRAMAQQMAKQSSTSNVHSMYPVHQQGPVPKRP